MNDSKAAEGALKQVSENPPNFLCNECWRIARISVWDEPLLDEPHSPVDLWL